jgi:hypothetical protein
MSNKERIVLYEKVKAKARARIRGSESVIAMQMVESMPVRFVKRGEKRSLAC